MDVWIARHGADGKPQVLRVDWPGITQRGDATTNFLLQAGDRLFLQARVAK